MDDGCGERVDVRLRVELVRDVLGERGHEEPAAADHHDAGLGRHVGCLRVQLARDPFRPGRDRIPCVLVRDAGRERLVVVAVDGAPCLLRGIHALHLHRHRPVELVVRHRLHSGGGGRTHDDRDRASAEPVVDAASCARSRRKALALHHADERASLRQPVDECRKIQAFRVDHV